MFWQICKRLLRQWGENKKLVIIPVVFIILMMTAISFSQIIMEIYAYTFITNKNVENRNIVEYKKAQEAMKAKQSVSNVKKVNNLNKSTDEKSRNVNSQKVRRASADSSVLSFVKPLKGGITSSEFGDTVSRTAKHIGHDWAVDTGTKIFASESGVVDRAYYSTSYGYNVLINHGNGIKTRYAHLSEISIIEGEYVKQNQPIGFSGNTGDSTGPHLHFEVIVNGKCCNPLYYIQ